MRQLQQLSTAAALISLAFLASSFFSGDAKLTRYSSAVLKNSDMKTAEITKTNTAHSVNEILKKDPKPNSQNAKGNMNP